MNTNISPIITSTKGLELHGVKRSSEWPKVMHDFLLKHPKCEICGSTEGLNVHHVINFEIVISLGYPELELLEDNLVTLCESRSGEVENNCHIKYGHGGSFFNFNPHIKEDIQKYSGTIYTKLQETEKEEIAKGVLPALDKMTVEQVEYVKNLIITWYKK